MTDRNEQIEKALKAAATTMESLHAALEGVELRFDLHPSVRLLKLRAIAARAALTLPAAAPTDLAEIEGALTTHENAMINAVLCHRDDRERRRGRADATRKAVLSAVRALAAASADAHGSSGAQERECCRKPASQGGCR